MLEKDWIAVGLGNSWRQDDGVGQRIALELARDFPLRVFPAGESPESLYDKILSLRPSFILVLDAARFERKPGMISLLPISGIEKAVLSTHRVPLPWLFELWREDAGSEILFLGIQPLLVGYGEGLSPRVEAAAGKIIRLLKALLSNSTRRNA